MKKRTKAIVACLMAVLLIALFSISCFADLIPKTEISSDSFSYSDGFDVSKGEIVVKNNLALGLGSQFNLCAYPVYNPNAFALGCYYAISYPIEERVKMSGSARFYNADSYASGGASPVYDVRWSLVPDSGDIGYTFTIREVNSDGMEVVIGQRTIYHTLIYSVGVLCWDDGNNVYCRLDFYGKPGPGSSTSPEYVQTVIHSKKVSTTKEASVESQFSIGDPSGKPEDSLPVGLEAVFRPRADWLNSVYTYADLKKASDAFATEYGYLTDYVLKKQGGAFYEEGRSDGYSDGYSTGYDNGKKDCAATHGDAEHMQYQAGYQSGYDDGMDAGVLKGESNVSTFKDAVNKIGDSLVKAFTIFTTQENGLFGYSLGEILAILISFFAIVWFLKKVF